MNSPKSPVPCHNEEARTALRDRLIVAMVQADMTRKQMFNCWGAANEAHQYIAAANRIASLAHPGD